MSNYKTIAVIGKYHARSRSYRFIYPRPNPSLRTADTFPVVASLPLGREATTGNASAVRRLAKPNIVQIYTCKNYAFINIAITFWIGANILHVALACLYIAHAWLRHFGTHQHHHLPQPHPTPPLFLSCKLTRRVNQNHVVTEPKQPGVHDYSEKGRNFVRDFPFS